MVEDSFRFRIACGTLYVGIVATTTITLVLCPPWQGVIYHRDREGVPWHASERFRLRGVNAYTNQAPIWNPPQPWSPPYSVARAVVRFPWQRITDGPNVEIMLGLVMTLISAVTATTGVLLWATYRITGRTPDRFVHVACCASVGLMIVGVLMPPVVFALLGLALDADELLFVVGPAIGALAGAIYGLVSTRRM